jgi:hypothetical protein
LRARARAGPSAEPWRSLEEPRARAGERADECYRDRDERARDDVRGECERSLEEESEEEDGLERERDRESAVLKQVLEVLLDDEAERRQEGERPQRQAAVPRPGRPSTA